MLGLFFSSRRRHTSFSRDWSSDVCSSDLSAIGIATGTCAPAADAARAGQQTRTIEAARRTRSGDSGAARPAPRRSGVGVEQAASGHPYRLGRGRRFVAVCFAATPLAALRRRFAVASLAVANPGMGQLEAMLAQHLAQARQA